MLEDKFPLEHARSTKIYLSPFEEIFEKTENLHEKIENLDEKTVCQDVYLTFPENEEEKPLDELEKSTIGDLYMLGKLWIEVLQTGLLGTKWKMPPILPVVHASPPTPPPKKPPRMKYKDLPLYTSPHYEYKDYLEDQPTSKCPELKRKLIHEKILPHVKSYRKEICQNYTDFVTECRSMKKQAMCNLNKKKNDFICYMRSCKNLRLRQGVLVLGGATGFLFGRRFKNKTTPKVFYTAVGLLAAGALCFPKETDETFRSISMCTGRFLVSLYNTYCHKRFALREKLPCQGDLPGPAPPRTPNKCN